MWKLVTRRLAPVALLFKAPQRISPDRMQRLIVSLYHTALSAQPSAEPSTELSNTRASLLRRP